MVGGLDRGEGGARGFCSLDSSALGRQAKLMQRLRPRLASTEVSLESTILTLGATSFLPVIGACLPII